METEISEPRTDHAPEPRHGNAFMVSPLDDGRGAILKGARILRAIAKWRAHRRLKMVVCVLPFALARRFGPKELYTTGQVRTTLDKLRIKPVLQIYGFAVGLAEEDFKSTLPQAPVELYNQLRREIATLYDMSEIDFTTKDIRDSRAMRELFKGYSLTLDKLGLSGGVAYEPESLSNNDP